jgi:WbqC-like protein family
MQPTYFPWAGYFNLIRSADVFVFLDDAQFERGTWHNRNRVLVDGRAHWLTVPTIRERLGSPLNEVGTDEKLPWRRKQIALLRQNYGRHAHGSEMLDLAERAIGDSRDSFLAILNMRIIAECCRQLQIKTPLLRASELGVPGTRSVRVARICDHLKCEEYLSPPGALEYLLEDGFCSLTPARLLIQDFQPEPYVQRGAAVFVSHLSILDVVANLGWRDAAGYIGRGAVTRTIDTTIQ